MSEVKEYKCPACGAPLYYDINKKSMSCHYCKNIYDLEYIRCHFDEVTSEKQMDFDWVERTKYVFEPYEIEKLEGFACPSCGGNIVTKASTATAKCPFCQHDVVISSDFSGDIRPDKVIPFRVESAEFADKYKAYVSDIKFIPKIFKDKSVLDRIVGCYVPVWEYSCICDSYIGSSYFGTATLKKYPILANENFIEKDVLYTLWPYNFRAAQEFTESCLTGFYASRYTIGAENAMKSVDSEVKRIGSLRATYNLESKRPPRDDYSMYKFSEVKTNEVIYNRKLTYYLVPMWVMNIQHKNKKYTFAMNGQTGAMRIDKLPTTPLYGHIKPLVFLILLFLEMIFELIVYKVRGVSFIDMLIPLTLSLLVFSFFNYLIAGVVNDVLLRKTVKKLDVFKDQNYFEVYDFVK